MAVSFGCEIEPSPSELADDVVDAYRLGKKDAGGQLMVQLEAYMGCLVEPLVPGDAAKIHRAFGLNATLDGAVNEANGYFGSAKIQDRSWTAPESERILWQTYTNVAGLEGLTTPLEEGQLALLVDGSPTHSLPESRPFLLQAYRADGRFYHSGMYGPKVPYEHLVGPNLMAEKKGLLLVKAGAVVGVLGIAVVAGSVAKSSAMNDLSSVGVGLSLGSSMTLAGVLLSAWGLKTSGMNEFSNSMDKVIK